MYNIFRKKDLKNINNINIDNYIFENNEIKELYDKYKTKTFLEIRIDMCIMENYFYLDLSEMELTNIQLIDIFENEQIIIILSKIEMLDLSNNNLSSYINFDMYNNIKYLNISFNKISNTIISNHIIELNCEHNSIDKIISNTIIRLIAHNNLIEYIELINVEYLIINNNKLTELCNFNNIKVLDCINNNILNIDYIKSLEILCCSTNKISKDYNIKNIEKIINNYYLDFI